MRWTVRVVVLTKVAISEEDKPSSYLLCMRAQSSGVVFPLPKVLGITQRANGAQRANLFIGMTCHATKLLSPHCTLA